MLGHGERVVERMPPGIEGVDEDAVHIEQQGAWPSFHDLLGGVPYGGTKMFS
jgi:hypothetical protein